MNWGLHTDRINTNVYCFATLEAEGEGWDPTKLAYALPVQEFNTDRSMAVLSLW